MVVRGAAAVTAAQASPGGASIGHILNDRMADMRAEMANMAALTKKGLALSSTDSNARALLAARDLHMSSKNSPCAPPKPVSAQAGILGACGAGRHRVRGGMQFCEVHENTGTRGEIVISSVFANPKNTRTAALAGSHGALGTTGGLRGRPRPPRRPIGPGWGDFS